jgi:hypothetical protein
MRRPGIWLLAAGWVVLVLALLLFGGGGPPFVYQGF